MNILITGGLGFIGLNLTMQLSDIKNFKIRILDKKPVSIARKSFNHNNLDFDILKPFKKKKFTKKIQFISYDLKNSKYLDNITYNCDIIIHLAASTGVIDSFHNPKKDFKNNVVGTINLLESARFNKIKKIIFASSSAPLGNVKAPINEKLIHNPLSPYGSSKAACENYLNSYFYSYGLSSVILRFSNVYGPGSLSKESVIAKFMKQIIASKEIFVSGNGKQSRDFIYIDDVVNAIIQSIYYKKKSAEVFHICSGEQRSVNYLISMLKKHCKKNKIYFPNIVYSQSNPSEIYKNKIINKKAVKNLNWHPNTYLKIGLINTIDYFFNLLSKK